MVTVALFHTDERFHEPSKKIISDLLKEVNNTLDEEFAVIERFYITGILLWRKVNVEYTLYKKLNNTEYQLINFHRERSDVGGTMFVEEDILMNYFYGLLNSKR